MRGGDGEWRGEEEREVWGGMGEGERGGERGREGEREKVGGSGRGSKRGNGEGGEFSTYTHCSGHCVDVMV